MTQLEEIFLEAVKLILAGLLGGLIGARANDRLTRNRERESGISCRKRSFLAFMAQFKAEAVNTHPTKWGDFFANKIPNIRHSAELIKEDFISEKRTEFETLVAGVCDLGENDIYNWNNKPEIILRTGKIIDFVKNTSTPR